MLGFWKKYNFALIYKHVIVYSSFVKNELQYLLFNDSLNFYIFNLNTCMNRSHVSQTRYFNSSLQQSKLVSFYFYQTECNANQTGNKETNTLLFLNQVQGLHILLVLYLTWRSNQIPKWTTSTSICIISCFLTLMCDVPMWWCLHICSCKSKRVGGII